MRVAEAVCFQSQCSYTYCVLHLILQCVELTSTPGVAIIIALYPHSWGCLVSTLSFDLFKSFVTHSMSLKAVCIDPDSLPLACSTTSYVSAPETPIHSSVFSSCEPVFT